VVVYPSRGNVGDAQRVTHSAMAVARIEAPEPRTRHIHSARLTGSVGDTQAKTAIARGSRTVAEGIAVAGIVVASIVAASIVAASIVAEVRGSWAAVQVEGLSFAHTELRRVQRSMDDRIRVFTLVPREDCSGIEQRGAGR